MSGDDGGSDKVIGEGEDLDGVAELANNVGVRRRRIGSAVGRLTEVDVTRTMAEGKGDIKDGLEATAQSVVVVDANDVRAEVGHEPEATGRVVLGLVCKVREP